MLLKDFDKYCMMVDKARRLDVPESMASKTWTTEEFQHVLAVHTSQVNVIFIVNHFQTLLEHVKVGLV